MSTTSQIKYIHRAGPTYSLAKPLYKQIANALDALEGLIKRDEINLIWESEWEDRLLLMNDLLPSGSGIDCGTKINLEKSKSNKIVLDVDFHHLNENGFYERWTSHQIIITPSLQFDFELCVTGRDYSSIKDYLADTFSAALNTHYETVFENKKIETEQTN